MILFDITLRLRCSSSFVLFITWPVSIEYLLLWFPLFMRVFLLLFLFSIISLLLIFHFFCLLESSSSISILIIPVVLHYGTRNLSMHSAFWYRYWSAISTSISIIAPSPCFGLASPTSMSVQNINSDTLFCRGSSTSTLVFSFDSDHILTTWILNNKRVSSKLQLTWTVGT